MALTGCALPEQLASQYQHESPAVRAALAATLRRLRHPAIKVFLADPNEWVLQETICAIHDDQSIAEALPDVADLLPLNKSKSEAITRRLLSANLRVGQKKNVDRLIDYAIDITKSSAMRAEALLCLRDWNRRPFVDRVEGKIRKLSKRNDGLSKLLVEKNLKKLFETSNDQVLAELIRLCEKLHIKLKAEQLLVIAKSQSQALAARIQAIQSIQQISAKHISNSLLTLTKDETPSIQVATINKIAEIEPHNIANILDERWPNLSEPAQQAFLYNLGKSNSAKGDEILNKAFSSLLKGNLSKSLELDVLVAAESRNTQKLKSQLEKYKANLPNKDTISKYKACLLYTSPSPRD